jgi:TolB-like protein
LFSELRRRNVLRMAAFYLAAAWLAAQVAEVFVGLGKLPDSFGIWVIAVLAIGFPIALIVSWFFDITPEGVVRDTDIPEGQHALAAGGRRTDFVIIAMLAAAVILLLVWEPPSSADEALTVLPFESMTGPDEASFSEGVSIELLNLLFQLRRFKVKNPPPADFLARFSDVPTLAREMGVRWVLKGSVRHAGQRVRIAVQLIDADDDAAIAWSNVFDRDLSAENLFAIQAEIARSIAAELRQSLDEPAERHLAGPPSKNTEAYSAYLLGRERLRDRKVAELKNAVDQFARAIELDPRFARAYAGLADACLLYYSYRHGQVGKPCPFAEGEEDSAKIDDLEPLVRKALSIDDEVGEAWVTLGRIRTFQAHRQGVGPEQVRLIREAQAAFKKGIELSPSYTRAYYWYAQSLIYIFSYDDPPNGWLTAWENGHWQSVVERGLEIDPLSLELHNMKAWYPVFSSTFEEAVAHAQRLIEIAPDSPQGYKNMAINEFYQGRLGEAISWWNRAAERDPQNANFRLKMARTYCELGDTRMAAAYRQQATQLLLPETLTGNLDVLIVDACDLLLSGDVYSGRLEEALQAIDESSPKDPYLYLDLRAMIDIAAGRSEDALARYKDYGHDICYEASGYDLPICHIEVMRVMQAAGDHERARRFAEERLKYDKPWIDRYPPYGTSFEYAKGLAVLGRTDEALDMLEALYASGWRATETHPFELEYGIALDSVRDHPRFQAVVAAAKADYAQQLENVRAMERRGEIPTFEQMQATIQ